MKKTVLILLLFGLFMVLYASSVSACSCAENPSVEVALEQSQAVYSGKVLDIERNEGKGNYGRLVHFEVTKTWKGIEDSQVIIVTGWGDGDCGFDFQVGQEYLVYANESELYGEKTLIAEICSRTTEISMAQDDLRVLGDGKLPQNDVALPFINRNTGGVILGDTKLLWGIMIAGVLFISIFAYIKRKRE